MFVNTIDKFGDESTMDMIIERTITEYCDNSAEQIGKHAFYGCAALRIVDLPNVSTIGVGSFSGCTILDSVILRSMVDVVALTNVNAFTGTPVESGTGYIYVPSTLVDSYKAATNWSTYAAQFRAIEDYQDTAGG